jgi:cation diffusion facilitator family transporter
MNQGNARREATRVTLVGMWLDIVLGLLKIIGGGFTQSFALITDGIHSLTDAVTDVFVILVTRAAHTEPDEEHPYGHGRFEALGTAGLGMLLFATAAILLYDAYQRLSNSEPIPVPVWSGLVIAALSILGKEWIYHYTMRVATRLNSKLLKANAWHSRSDAISSIAVFIGILGALQGYPWMDTLAAVVVSLIIAKIGWGLCTDSIRELVDTAIPAGRQRKVRDCILSIEGIHELSSLRSRLSGGQAILEIQILVDPRISVSEGHQLGEMARKSVIKKFKDINDVIVHIDPESHSIGDQTENLPLRQEIIENIKSRWGELLEPNQIQAIDLHYLQSGVEVDLVLKHNQIDAQLTERLRQAIDPLSYISRLRIFNELYEAELTSRLS